MRALIEQHIESVLQYLTPYMKFINCHMVSYFTEDHWNTFLPREVKEELKDEQSINEAWSSIMGGKGYDANLNAFPSLNTFIQNSKQHTLLNMPDICLNLETFQKEMKAIGYDINLTSNIKFKEFMSSKKNHEVEVISSIVANLCKSYTTQKNKELIVIDAGDGKGYLSSRIAFEHHMKVIGIDSSPVHTKGAEKRKNKLDRAWKVLTKHPVNDDKTDSNADQKQTSDKKEFYKTFTQFIDETTDFREISNTVFQSCNAKNFCLTGLHTCGNLASNCLKIFSSNEQIQLLCNVGCCYHLLVEQFGIDTFFNVEKYESNKSSIGFPMSNLLKHRGFYLGRNARMLASQSIFRFFAGEQSPNHSLMYRAMLEILLCKRFDKCQRQAMNVGKSKAKTFQEYVELSFKKFELTNDNPSQLEIFSIEKEYATRWNEMKFFYLFRVFFAPVIETLITLDRLLFLIENGFDRTFLVRLFDQVISPRCYGIISIK